MRARIFSSRLVSAVSSASDPGETDADDCSRTKVGAEVWAVGDGVSVETTEEYDLTSPEFWDVMAAVVTLGVGAGKEVQRL